MDKIHAMQLFIRVADLESFSRAAETLALPKGSVSCTALPAGFSSPRMGWSTMNGQRIC